MQRSRRLPLRRTPQRAEAPVRKAGGFSRDCRWPINSSHLMCFAFRPAYVTVARLVQDPVAGL